MSIFYSFGTGALKGIEEQNERRYKMIEQMAPLMQQTYLDSQDKIKRAQDNVNALNENLGVAETTALRTLYKTQIDTSENPIETAQTIIDNLGGIDSDNFKQIVAAKGSTEAPAFTGQSKYDASKKFFEDNNIIGPAAFDLLNQANQQPMAGQQVTEQAMIPEGQTMQVTQQDAADQPVSPSVSTNIFGVDTRPATFADDVYHGPLFDVYNKTESSFAGTKVPYDQWLTTVREIDNPNYNEKEPISEQNQKKLKQTNEEIYNNLLTRQDPGREEIIANKQQEQEGGSITYDSVAYLSEIQKLTKEIPTEGLKLHYEFNNGKAEDLSDNDYNGEVENVTTGKEIIKLLQPPIPHRRKGRMFCLPHKDEG